MLFNNSFAASHFAGYCSLGARCVWVFFHYFYWSDILCFKLSSSGGVGWRKQHHHLTGQADHHSSYNLESGYFAIKGIFPLEAILLSPFMCVYIAIIA